MMLVCYLAVLAVVLPTALTAPSSPNDAKRLIKETYVYCADVHGKCSEAAAVAFAQHPHGKDHVDARHADVRNAVGAYEASTGQKLKTAISRMDNSHPMAADMQHAHLLSQAASQVGYNERLIQHNAPKAVLQAAQKKSAELSGMYAKKARG